MKKNILNIIAMITLSSLLRAVAMQLFLLPNNILVGGVLGIAGTLNLLFTGEIFRAAYWLVILNIPLLIAAYFALGRRLTWKTLANVFVTAAFMWIIDYLNLAEFLGTTAAEYKVLYAIIGGALSGLALPLMLSVQGSTGGSDIVSLLIRKSSSKSLMRINLYVSVGTIIVGALALQNFDIFVFSIVTLFCSQITEEQIFRGYSSAIAVEIVTEKPEEVAQKLMKELHHGVTAVSITGMYSLTNKTKLICVMNRRQLSLARKIMRETDPSAFAYVVRVKEVVGRGFVNKEEDLDKNTDEL
ncbi:MAG TPA: YitT family protein [Clostridia bacterium]|nr:YitT family protein [Clostridia bacterium]